ncbi:hypothetical protein ACSBOB_04445 [Mesorhizobium sp. ASY16-5R]
MRAGSALQSFEAVAASKSRLSVDRNPHLAGDYAGIGKKMF